MSRQKNDCNPLAIGIKSEARDLIFIEKHMLRLFCLVILYVTLFSVAAMADGFDTFAAIEKLKGSVIVEAADAEFIPSPRGILSKDVKVKVVNYCFEPTEYFSGWSYGKRAALILIDQQKNIKLALFDNGIGSVNLSVIAVSQVSCF
jgi:hypothetical protein